jgi:hypothetical protein
MCKLFEAAALQQGFETVCLYEVQVRELLRGKVSEGTLEEGAQTRM